MTRFAVSIAVFLGISTVSLTSAYLIYFSMQLDSSAIQLWLFSLPLFLLVKATVFITLTDLIHQRPDSIRREFAIIVVTPVVSSAILAAALVAGLLENAPTASIIAVDCGLTILANAMLRIAVHCEPGIEHMSKTCRHKIRAVLVATDSTAMVLAKSLQSKYVTTEIVAMIDESNSAQGTSKDVPIVKRSKGVAAIARRYRANHLIISERIPGAEVRTLMQDARKQGLVVKIATDVGTTRSAAWEIRDLKMSDLYRTQSTQLEILDFLADKTVLVTGAAGGLGSELCRQILGGCPKILILVDRSEAGMLKVKQELAERQTVDSDLVYSLCDVNDPIALGGVFKAHLPDIVFHAAGYHHADLMETNVPSVIRNNVLGTKSVVDLAERFGIERLIQISSHQAFDLTGIAGAATSICEQYTQALAATSKTQFVTVRVGDSLESESVASLIAPANGRSQSGLDLNREVAITSNPDLARRILRAAAYQNSGQIWALGHGQRVRFADLAKDHTFVSLKSGLHEVSVDSLQSADEPIGLSVSALDLEKQFPMIEENVFAIECEPVSLKTVKLNLQHLERASHGDAFEVDEAIRSIVPSYAGSKSQETVSAAARLSKTFIRKAG